MRTIHFSFLKLLSELHHDFSVLLSSAAAGPDPQAEDGGPNALD